CSTRFGARRRAAGRCRRGVERHRRRTLKLCAEAECRTGLGFGGLLFATPWPAARFERRQQSTGNACNLIHRGVEGRFVGFRWFGESADLSHKLQRGGADFLVGYRRLEVEERSDVATHTMLLVSRFAG